jgi:hypothetical protein
MNKDQEHIRLLSIFHYIMAGLLALGASIPIIHLIIGILFVSGVLEDSNAQAATQFIGWMFIAIGATIIVIGWAIATCTFYAGRCLARKINYTFCLVVAGINCLFMPMGTILGIFTIVVLMRPGVKEMFGEESVEPISIQNVE